MSSSKCSCLVRFLNDPWSPVKVFLPSLAIEVILHRNVWQKTPLRHLTLYLVAVNVYWLATSVNWGLLETPLLLQLPSLDDRQKMETARHRFSFLNKVEVRVPK